MTIDGTETRVLVEQTTAVNAETRLGDFAGRLDAEELTELDRALALVLGLF
ncbi:type II toxin-antitoxin system PemK/MazF family toxin [Arachnia propionica]